MGILDCMEFPGDSALDAQTMGYAEGWGNWKSVSELAGYVSLQTQWNPISPS